MMLLCSFQLSSPLKESRTKNKLKCIDILYTKTVMPDDTYVKLGFLLASRRGVDDIT